MAKCNGCAAIGRSSLKSNSFKEKLERVLKVLLTAVLVVSLFPSCPSRAEAAEAAEATKAVETAALKSANIAPSNAATLSTKATPKYKTNTDAVVSIVPALAKAKVTATIAKYKDFKEELYKSSDTIVPGLKQTNEKTCACKEMVPQGICNVGDYKLISAYCGKGKGEKKHKSVIYVLDSRGKYLVTLVTDTEYHVGSIAYDNKNKKIYVAAGGSVKKVMEYTYGQLTSAISKASSKKQDCVTGFKCRREINVDNIPSCISFANGKLCVGTFAPNKDTETTNEDSKIVEYTINDKSDKGTPCREIQLYNGDSRLVQMQGFCYKGSSLILSQSAGAQKPSHLIVASYSKTGTKSVGDVSVDVAKAKQLQSYEIPPMAEDICFGSDSNTIEMIFESASKVYKDRSDKPCKQPIDRVVTFKLPAAATFEYKVGRYICCGKVYNSKCWYGTKTTINSDGDYTKETRVKGYACEFSGTIQSVSGINGYTESISGLNCGKGIYITGYKGSKNANAVVPNKINGQPVVCVDIGDVKLKTLDVSQSTYLQAFEFGGMSSTVDSIKFGENKQLSYVSLFHTTVKKKLVIKPKNVRYLNLGEANSFWKGASWWGSKLRFLRLWNMRVTFSEAMPQLRELQMVYGEVPAFNLSKMPKLEKLSLMSCGLKKLDVSKNKKLKSIYAPGNKFNSKTKAALQKWAKAKKGRSLEI